MHLFDFINRLITHIVLLLGEMLDGFNFHARVERRSAQRGSCQPLYSTNILLSLY